MVQQTREKPSKKPPNRAQRPMIWEDSMAEVKETFRRVAMVKHSGFSVWDDPRRGPTLERILRWNRQARNLSQVPKSLREKIPTKVLKEIQNNRSVTGYVSQTHLQNVKGMCQRIRSQKSVSERRKNMYDPSMYPVFVRRPPTVASVIEHHTEVRRRPHSSPAAVESKAPLSYTPQPFKLLYDISNGSYPKRPRSVPSSAVSCCYGKLFNRSGSSASRKSSVMDIAEAVRASSAPGGSRRQHHKRFPLTYDPSPPSSSEGTPNSRGWITLSNRSNTESDSTRPPSRCTSRPTLSLVELPSLDDLSNRSTYYSEDDSLLETTTEDCTRPRVSVPKLRLRGGDSFEMVQKTHRPSTANVPVLSSESDLLGCNWRPQSASNAVGRRGSRVTFASPVESDARGSRLDEGTSQTELMIDRDVTTPDEVEETEVDNEDVIIKHSADPYYDFKSSMMVMIESEGLRVGSRELEDLFQYYLDLNPKMHHHILAKVFEDIKLELMR